MDEMNMTAAAAQEETAAQSAAAEQERAEPCAQEASAGQEGELRQFRELFPQAAADPETIDPAVWQRVREGRSLPLAFACHALEAVRAENEQLKEQLERLRKEADNLSRSTGSLASVGRDKSRGDAFTAGWNA